MTANSQPAIHVAGLSKSFPGVRAVDHLTFDVQAGEIFGLVGPDGAGKTTTLRMLAGVMPPDEGSAIVAGFDVGSDPEGAKHHLSYMPQRFGLYEDLTVDENIRFYADLFGVSRAEREQRSPELLRAAGMSEFRKRLAGQLSGGMKQKLGLVCALIHRPKVILLDEPTTGVDPVSRRDFWRILYNLVSEGVAILTSTAYLDEAERCQRVALVHQGKLLFCDTPPNLKARLGKGVLAVISTDPRRLREELEKAGGISSLVLTGDGVHAVVDDLSRRLPEFEARLRSAQVPFDEIRQATPTIEDVFVDAVTAGRSQP
ncbi:MAG TPA: ABC transporter ATP-binding protein [Terriglobales bacterium]|jgi:ABC-2 type transport system ATP-binding protein|nr:ABC transporter ATP-binding protein [Terriglobales bacterium]